MHSTNLFFVQLLSVGQVNELNNSLHNTLNL